MSNVGKDPKLNRIVQFSLEEQFKTPSKPGYAIIANILTIDSNTVIVIY
jgi:hypothetical protein